MKYLSLIYEPSSAKVHKKELEYIIEQIAGPWKIPKNELISLVKSAENEIPNAQILIRLIENYS